MVSMLNWIMNTQMMIQIQLLMLYLKLWKQLMVSVFLSQANCVSYIFQQLTVMMKLVIVAVIALIVTMIAGVYYLNEMLKVSMAEWSK